MNEEEKRELGELKEKMLTIDSKVNKIEQDNTVPTHFHKTDRIDYLDLKGGIPTINATPTHVAVGGKTYIHATNYVLYVKVGDSWKYIQMS